MFTFKLIKIGALNFFKWLLVMNNNLYPIPIAFVLFKANKFFLGFADKETSRAWRKHPPEGGGLVMAGVMSIELQRQYCLKWHRGKRPFNETAIGKVAIGTVFSDTRSAVLYF